MNNMISLVEYAELNGISDATARQRVERGTFKTAVKIGRNWIIDKDEPLIDKRVKDGKYIDAKKQKKPQKD